MGRPVRFEITKGSVGGREKAFQQKILSTADGEENIIVIGTQQHSGSSTLRNLAGRVGPNAKFMFIHQALRKVILNPEQRWTILLCREGYSDPQQTTVVDRFVELNCKVVRVSSARHIINYINNGNGDRNLDIHEDRTSRKVSRLQFYGHGYVGVIALGMTIASDSSAYKIAQSEAGQLNPEAFHPHGKVYSFACRSGIGNPAVNESVYETNMFGNRTGVQHNLLSRQSIAQYVANGSHSTTYAYLRRTEYSDTLNTSDELDFMDFYEARQRGRPPQRESGRQRYAYLLDQERRIPASDQSRYTSLRQLKLSRSMVDGAVFDPAGAAHSVRAAASPEGVPGDMQTFQPD